jgi:hypothetical protein
LIQQAGPNQTSGSRPNGPKNSSGVGKAKNDNKKDAKAVIAEAKAQQEDKEAINNPDLMESEEVEQKKKKNEKVTAGLLQNMHEASTQEFTSQQRAPLPKEIDDSAAKDGESDQDDDRDGSPGLSDFGIGERNRGPPEAQGDPPEAPEAQGDSPEAPKAQGGPPQVPEHQGDPPETPESQGNAPEAQRDPEEEDLWSFRDMKKELGELDDGEIAAWREIQRGATAIIVQWGPPNSRKYELSTPSKSGIKPDESTDPQFGPDFRRGDEKVGRKYVRTTNELKGILGVAMAKGLTPDLKPKAKGETRKFPRVYLYCKWEIHGETIKCWEVRASIKHLYARPEDCDKYIYLRMQRQEQRYAEWLSGQRRGNSNSTSPGPAELLPGNQRETSIEAANNLAAQQTVKTEPGTANGASIPTLPEFMEMYMSLFPAGHILDTKEKLQVMKDYKEQYPQLVTVA